MSSRFQFEIMTEQQARAVLANKSDQAEMYPDKIRALHRLQRVTTDAELARNRAYLEEARKP